MKSVKVQINGSPSMPMSAEKPEGKYPDYKIEDAANTLMRAEEIKNNSALMGHVNKHLAKKKHAINSISALKAKAQSRMEEMNDTDSPAMEASEGE